MTDQNRKTLRSFYCRDYLWELFEQMTHDLGCSMDYLINESMRLYARSRDYVPNEHQEGPGAGMGGPGQSGYPPPQRDWGGSGQGGRPSGGGSQLNVGAGGGAMEHRTFDRIPPVGGQGQPQQGNFPQRGGAGGGQGGPGLGSGPGGPPPPPPRPGDRGGHSSGGWPQQSEPGGGYNTGGGFNGQPQMGGQQQPPIYLLFNNNRYVIDKDKFVIGRGSQHTDLTIRDGNISRKHCAVIFRNGNYYIKDLESTNGVEYRGSRIESKKIEEGDVFYLCDYELRFTYRG